MLYLIELDRLPAGNRRIRVREDCERTRTTTSMGRYGTTRIEAIESMLRAPFVGNVAKLSSALGILKTNECIDMLRLRTEIKNG